MRPNKAEIEKGDDLFEVGNDNLCRLSYFCPRDRDPNNVNDIHVTSVAHQAIFNDAGDGPGRDVISEVDELVKRGFVTPERIGTISFRHPRPTPTASVAAPARSTRPSATPGTVQA